MPFSDAFAALKCATDPTSLDAALSTLGVGQQMDASERRELQAFLIKLESNTTLVTNTKLRRRIKRLLEQCTDADPKAAAVRGGGGAGGGGGGGGGSAPSSANVKMSTRSQSNQMMGSTKSTPPPSSSSNTSNVTFSEAFTALKNASDPSSLDTALSSLGACQDIDASKKSELKALLEKIESDTSLTNNSKLRRRVKRQLERIQENSASMSMTANMKGNNKVVERTAQSSRGIPTTKQLSHQQASQQSKQQHQQQQQQQSQVAESLVPQVKTRINHNPPPGPPLDAVISAISSFNFETGDVNDIETILQQVTSGCGDAKSRRTLKRQLDKIVSEKDALLNSKVRRKIKRTLEILHPHEGTGAKVEEIDPKKEEEEEANKKKNKKRKADEMQDKEKEKKPSFIVFIGQLSYSTKAEDVKKFLQKHGVEGSIDVRLLTEVDTGKSRGMCFVQLDNSTDFGRCLDLDKSELHGRFINVEKSSRIKKFNNDDQQQEQDEQQQQQDEQQ